MLDPIPHFPPSGQGKRNGMGSSQWFYFYLFTHKRDEQALEAFPSNPISRRDGHVVAMGNTDRSDIGGFGPPKPGLENWMWNDKLSDTL
jgi:hypothetical protein